MPLIHRAVPHPCAANHCAAWWISFITFWGQHIFPAIIFDDTIQCYRHPIQLHSVTGFLGFSYSTAWTVGPSHSRSTPLLRVVASNTHCSLEMKLFWPHYILSILRISFEFPGFLSNGIAYKFSPIPQVGIPSNLILYCADINKVRSRIAQSRSLLALKNCLLRSSWSPFVVRLTGIESSCQRPVDQEWYEWDYRLDGIRWGNRWMRSELSIRWGLWRARSNICWCTNWREKRQYQIGTFRSPPFNSVRC